MKITGNIDISSLLAAFEKFKAALPEAKSDLEKAGLIQYFEFTFELSWKTMKRVLADRGKILNSPKSVIREAALEGIIASPEHWIGFVKDRNDTVHSYNKDIADQIYSSLASFELAVEDLIERLKKLQ